MTNITYNKNFASDKSRKNRCFICYSEINMYIDEIWDDRYGCPILCSITRCSFCGQMDVLPKLKEEDLPELYSKYYSRADHNIDDILKQAKRVLSPSFRLQIWLEGNDNQGQYLAKKGESILDIGCGACVSLLELRELGFDAYGIEADPSILPIIERFNLKVHIGSIYDNPFDGLKFDLIIMNQVIEHIIDPVALLHSLKSRLTKNGRIILGFPNANSIYRHAFGKKWINWHVPFHQHHFNKKSFNLMVSKEGFEILACRTITPNLWTVLQILAMKSLPKRGEINANWSLIKRPENTSLIDLACYAWLRTRNKGIGLALTIVNRIVDLIGQGDSLLVEIRLKHSE